MRLVFAMTVKFPFFSELVKVLGLTQDRIISKGTLCIYNPVVTPRLCDKTGLMIQGDTLGFC